MPASRRTAGRRHRLRQHRRVSAACVQGVPGFRQCDEAGSLRQGGHVPSTRGGRGDPGRAGRNRGEGGLMSLREFRRAGHPPTLAAAFLYFDVSFMVWVLLGPLAPFLSESLKLTATQKGVLTAIPLLGGSFFRPILGWMTERYGGRRTGLIGLGVSLIPLAIGWQLANSYGQFLALGLLLGVAGASFAAALPLASAWYPPEHQGLAMGIAGAGNSGTL